MSNKSCLQDFVDVLLVQKQRLVFSVMTADWRQRPRVRHHLNQTLSCHTHLTWIRQSRGVRYTVPMVVRTDPSLTVVYYESIKLEIKTRHECSWSDQSGRGEHKLKSL
jgi:hypothetical protein